MIATYAKHQKRQQLTTAQALDSMYLISAQHARKMQRSAIRIVRDCNVCVD